MPQTASTRADRPPAPRFGLASLRRVAADAFGIDGEASELPSYADRNALIQPSAGAGHWVLKIAGVAEPRSHLEMQIEMIRRLRATLPDRVPEVRGAKTGEALVEVTGDDGRRHLAWMVSLLPGALLRDARKTGSATWRDLGQVLAHVHRSLDGLEHPALTRRFRWNLADAGWTIAYAGKVANGTRRAILERAQLRWLAEVHRRLDSLPVRVLHNDANPANVTVNEDEDEALIAGIFDFGDAIQAPRVFELAIAGAYAVFGAADPLAPLVDIVRGYEAVAGPLEEEELAALVPAAAMRLVTSLTVSTLDARIDPENDYVTSDQRDAWAALERLDAIPPRLALRRLREALRRPVDPKDPWLSREAVRAKRERHMSSALSLSYAEPLELVRGRGAYLFDKDGAAYLDCVNNVCHVGHAHPDVVAAAAAQMGELNTNTRYLHDNAVLYAERLASLFPDPLEVVFFVNSGSEANELALRLARAATGRRDMLAIEHGYHGNTQTLIELSHYKHAGRGGAGTPDWVRIVPCPDPLRRPEEDGAAHGVQAALTQGPVAGILAEPLIGCGGQVVPPAGWLRSAFDRVRAAGGVCIADEVQVGFGRVGTHWWAFEEQGATPDIVTLGKPIGNGHPMAAVVTTRAVADAFANGMEWFNTFGGNPVSCAVGLAVLDVIEDAGLRANARKTGARLVDGLNELKRIDGGIADVRGRGLYVGMEFVRDRKTLDPDTARLADVIERCRASGVLLSSDGPHANVLKIKPPLVFDEWDAELLLATLDRALAETRP